MVEVYHNKRLLRDLYLCIGVFCLNIFIYTKHMQSQKNQRGTSEPMDMDMLMFMNYHMGDGT